jgi:hypothetical protein
MAISLITEVMDWAPKTLTHREHKVLMILAEDARADSRIIWRSIESPQTLRRLRLSRTQLYVVIAALMAKGCLELVTQAAGDTSPSTGSPCSRRGSVSRKT